jgi:hypothetical protein
MVLSTLAALGACSGDEPASTADNRLNGSWRLVKAEAVGPDGTKFPGSTQEILLLISDGYYSINWAGGQEPSPYYAERFAPNLAWQRIESADGVSDPNTAAGVRYHYQWIRIERSSEFREIRTPAGG